MRVFRRHFLLALLAGSLAAAAHAQSESEPLPRPHTPPRNVRFDHLPEKLNVISTQAIWQDRSGFMWFGVSGLVQYDGYTARRFKHDPSNPQSLSSNDVRVLYEDSAGRLWVGTSQGLNRYDAGTETFIHYRHDAEDPNSVSSDRIGAVLEDRDGSLWVGTGGMSTFFQARGGAGLNRFDPESETFTHYRHAEDEPGSLSHDWVGALLEDRQGRLWVGSWGLNRFDPETGTFEHFLPNPAFAAPVAGYPDALVNWVTSVLEDETGRFWVGTVGGSFYRFDPETGLFTNYRNDPGDEREGLTGAVAGDMIYSVLEDPEGGLWLGTLHEGLIWVDPETGTSKAYRHDPQDPYSLSGDIVRSLYKDRQGGIWAGTIFQGVNHLDRTARRFEHLYARPGDPNSLDLDTYGPLTLYEGPDRALWVTSGIQEGRGVVNRFDRATGIVRRFRHDPNDPNSLAPGVIWAVFVDSSGAVWTGGERLSRMDPGRPGHFTHFYHDPSDSTSLGPGAIRSLFRDAQGTLWVGDTQTGLSRLDDPIRGRFTHFPIGDRFGLVNSIYEDSEGLFWLGTNSTGLYRFDPEAETYTSYRLQSDNPASLSSRQIYGVCESPLAPGVLWIGAYQEGLQRFDKQTKTFRNLAMHNSDLPDNGVQGVLCDDQGLVWVSTDNGLSRFDPRTETFENFDLDDGLQGLSFNSWAYHKSPYTGELFFGGTGGLNAFYPGELRGNPHPPEVVLTGMKLFGEPVSVGEGSPLDRPLSETEGITLQHRENDLTFEYVGLHFSNPAENRYAYKLEPYDADWREVGAQRTASFTNLDPGTYTFHVKAANSDGVWNEEGASLTITIQPPWWQTTGAYVLYALLFVAGIFVVDRVQRRRLIRKEREKARERELEQAREIEKAHTELQHAHTHLKATQAQLVQQEKMASLGQLTAGIAHEIKNPLNFVNNFAEVNEELAQELREDLADHPEALAAVNDLLGDLEQNASVIAQHGKRADGIVRSMMQHVSGGTGQREAVDLNALIDEHIELAYHGKRAQTPGFTVEINRAYDEAVEQVEVVPREIGRVLLNLLSNAFDAVHEHAGTNGEYAPAVTVSTERQGDTVEIRVSDNGPGIPPEIQEKIFEPFYTTKPTGSGTGLGLSLSYDIVTQGHGGTLTVERSQNKGATFIITIPASPSPPTPP